MKQTVIPQKPNLPQSFEVELESPLDAKHPERQRFTSLVVATVHFTEEAPDGMLTGKVVLGPRERLAFTAPPTAYWNLTGRTRASLLLFGHDAVNASPVVEEPLPKLPHTMDVWVSGPRFGYTPLQVEVLFSGVQGKLIVGWLTLSPERVYRFTITMADYQLLVNGQAASVMMWDARHTFKAVTE